MEMIIILNETDGFLLYILFKRFVNYFIGGRWTVTSVTLNHIEFVVDQKHEPIVLSIELQRHKPILSSILLGKS